MRAAIARVLRALADRFAGQSEHDSVRLDVRRLEGDLAALDRKFKAECDYVERLLAERDLAAGQAKFWAGESAKTTRLMIDMGAARDAAASPVRAEAVVHYPVFGRRNRPAAPTLPGPAA